MGRILATLALAFLLSGCWLSEQRLFGPADWAHLDLSGTYTSVDSSGRERARVELTVRPDGLLETTESSLSDDLVEHAAYGLVPVTGGSGDYFLMVDRTNENEETELYLLVHLTDEGELETYWPDCAGTPDVEGMTRDLEQFAPDVICAFESKQAVLRAALVAERFLSQPQIVKPIPLGTLLPVKEPAPDEGSAD